MFNIFNIFRGLEIKGTGPFLSGANVDIRSKEEKEKDYRFEELVATAAPVKWVEKPQSEWRSFPIFNQDASGSCVAQTMAKMLGVLYWLKNSTYVHFSATHVYQRRNNKPNGGMAGINVFEIAQEGVTLEELVPSQDMNDSTMDNIYIADYKKEVGEVFKIGNYLTLPNGGIEYVASVIQTTGKPVMVWFFYNSPEWSKDVPTVNDRSLKAYLPSTLRHSVTAVDFTLYKGKKAIIIEDSWGTYGSFNGQRIITEDFFKARNFFTAYTMNFDFDTSETIKPIYTFSVDLEFNQTNDQIKKLQDILKYEGLFPKNTDSTGYYGAITRKAVQDFQIKHGIASENTPGFGRVGPLTRSKLNELYSN